MKQPWQLIWNPAAGMGRAGRRRAAVEAALRASGIPFEAFSTDAPGQAPGFAAARQRAGRRWFLVGGGDGTINEVVNGLLRDGVPAEQPCLAALPLGSGNDWLRSRGLPRDLVGLVALLARRVTRPCDVGFVEPLAAPGATRRYFVNGVGMGLDVHVLRALPRLRPPALRYAVALMRAFAGYRPAMTRMRCDGHEVACRALVVIAALGAYSGGGMCLTPHAGAAPGRFALTVVDDLPLWRLIVSFRQIYDGSIGERPEVEFMHAAAIEITEPAGELLETDGEIALAVPARIGIVRDAYHALTVPATRL